MPGRTERTSGARKSLVCLFRERAVSASSRVCLAQAMMAGHRQRPCGTFRGRSSSVYISARPVRAAAAMELAVTRTLNKANPQSTHICQGLSPRGERMSELEPTQRRNSRYLAPAERIRLVIRAADPDAGRGGLA